MSSPLPIQSGTHIQESNSVLKFSEIISPWRVIQAPVVEYGTDITVEITRGIGDLSKNRHATNLSFHVQLKSSKKKPLKDGSRTVSVKPASINYWYGGNLPTMLAYFDENTQVFYFKWVDSNFITELDNRSPNWRSNKSVTIRLNAEIPTIKDRIEEYVCKWKRPLQASIPSEIYFEVNDEIEKSIQELSDLAKNASDSFLIDSLSGIKSSLSSPIYSIGIAGESRTGKSTLINAILKRQVTPTGLTKTTGVPISVSFALKEECIIVFENKKDEVVKFDFDIIKQFASQDYNKGNKKRVKSINLKVNNPNLEKGIYIYDLPGLNDANEKIRNLTKSILITTNAVVYVMNGGLIETGDFIVHKSIVADLRELYLQKDYVFIAVNKVDNISKQETFRALKKAISSELADNQLESLNPDKFIYISAKKSFDETPLGEFAEDVSILNMEIWRYLLKNDKTGAKRLIGGLNQLINAIERAHQLEAVKLLNSKEKSKLEQKIKEIELKKTTICQGISSQEDEIFRKIENHVISQAKGHLQNLHTQLNKLSLNQPMFTSKQIKYYLQEDSLYILNQLQTNFNQEINKLQNSAAAKVQKLLRDKSNTQKLSQFEKQNYWIVQNLFTNNQSGNFVEVFFNLSIAIFTELIESIANLFREKSKVRSQKIAKIMKESNKFYKKIFKKLLAEVKRRIAFSIQSTVNLTSYQIDLYLNNLKTKIRSTGETVEPHKQEQIEEYLKGLEKTSESIKLISKRLKPFI